MRKRFSRTILVLLLVQLIFAMNLSREVKAAEDDNSSVPEFMDVRKETLGFAYQYKDKTIVNNAVIFDNNIKFFVEENGEKHIISEDFDLIRHLRFIGIYNENAYVISEQNQQKSIYKVDLNTYKMEFVKPVPTYGDGNAYITNYTIDSNGVFWFEAKENNVPIYSQTGIITDYNTKYIIYNDNGFSHETLRLQDSNTTYDSYGQLEKGLDASLWFSKSFKLGSDNKIYRISKDNNIKEYSINTNDLIECVYPGADNTLFVATREFVKTESEYQLGKSTIKKYKINNDALELVKEFDFTGDYFHSSFDSNRSLWINESGVISKLEDNGFVKKYIVNDSMKALKVYDDKHLVVYGIVGIGYTPISIEELSEKPTDNTNTETNSNTNDGKNNNTNDGTNSNTNTNNNNTGTSSNTNVNKDTNTSNDTNIDINSNPVQQTSDLEKFTTVINNNEEPLPTLNSDSILKDSVKEIVPTSSNDIQDVDTKDTIDEVNDTISETDSTINFTSIIFIALGVILISAVGFWLKKNK
ncbi:hypothetical protein [Clostridium sp.]|uniref:hypothetical protein n=1 Tax=Clostridium sp. TaxID=1506 RepID=UPI003216B9FB